MCQYSHDHVYIIIIIQELPDVLFSKLKRLVFPVTSLVSRALLVRARNKYVTRTPVTILT